MSFPLNKVKSCLIVGGSGGIGLALVHALSRVSGIQCIFATYRNSEKASALLKLEANDPQKITAVSMQFDSNNLGLDELTESIKAKTHSLDLIINCVGVLNDDHSFPEKLLSQITADSLLNSFQSNAMLTPLLAKALVPFIPRNTPSVFAVLSAKVGSIEDNRLGGWYGYRASKAALNMFVKNIAIELSTKRKNCIVLALHPGTTLTDLSRKYVQKTKLTLHSPEQTAANLLKVLESKTAEHDSGSFFDWQNERLPF